MARRIIFLFLNTITFFVYGQECGEICRYLNNDHSTIINPVNKYCECATTKFIELDDYFNDFINKNNIPRQENMLGQQIKLLAFFPLEKIPDSVHLEFLFNRALYNSNINRLTASERDYKQIIGRIETIDPHLSNIQFAELHSLTLKELSDNSSAQSKFTEAINHLQYSINTEIRRVRGTSKDPVVFSLLSKIGQNLMYIGDTITAYQYFRQGNEVIKASIPKMPLSTKRDYSPHFLGYLSFELEAAIALDMISEAEEILKLCEQVNFNDLPPHFKLSLLKAQFYNKKGEYESKTKFLKKARVIAYQNAAFSDDQILYHIVSSQFLAEKKYLEYAIAELDTASELSLKLLERSTRWSRNMILARTQKIKLLRSVDRSEVVRDELESFVKEISEKLQGSVLFEDHISFIDDFYPLFELGLEVVYEDQNERNLALAFEIMECVSSINLYKESLLASAQTGENRDSLIIEYKKKTTLLNQHRLQDASGDSMLTFNNNIYNLNQSIDNIKEQLVSLTDQPKPIDLLHYKSSLNQKTCHVLTFAGKHSYFFLRIQANDINLFKRGSTTLDSIGKKMAPSLPNAASENHYTLAKELGAILQDILTCEGYQKLVFSGDGVMRLIPLEALIVEEKMLVHLPIDISYCPSARMLYNLKQNNYDGSPSLAIFKPSFSDEMALDFAEKESQNIHRALNGDLYENENSTKRIFLNNCEKYDIIHLATHGQSFPDSSAKSYIEFTDEKLYFEEIRSLILNTDFVYMAACETNVGENYNGEGVMSLARNFMASGAKSVISSMWSIPDQSTSEITVSFYKYLKKGETKSAALKKAKQDWLEVHPYEGSHPFYWAGLVLTGSDDALYQTRLHLYFYLAVFGICLVSLNFLYKNKRWKTLSSKDAKS